MLRSHFHRSLAAALALVVTAMQPGFAADRWQRTQEPFVNWEDPHVHPLDLTPDGARLLAVNTADNSLLVFNVASGTPVLESTIAVGLDPVSVRARTNTEAWVVNRISDSVTVVDLTARTVTAVLAADDEPADVIFAGSPQRAYVSCAKPSLIDIWNPADLTVAVQRVFVNGKEPRALAASADGSKVYVAFFESSNGTTLVTGGKDNGFEVDLVRRPEGPYGGINFPPNRGTQYVPALNPANPAPPPVGMIVRKDATGHWKDDNNGDWTRFISGDLAGLGGANGGRVAGWDLPDRDVAILDTASLGVTYQTRLMNSLMALAVRPGSGEVTVVGLDATNEIRWEPNLQGTFTRVNLARFVAGAASTITDLNPHLNYQVRNVPMATRLQSIGDPRGIAWNADGSRAWITGMGSNNVVVIDGSGARVGRIDVGEGPTGVVFSASNGRVFVLNKFEASISVINVATSTEMTRVPFFDPTPTAIKAGRQFLYNTHNNSGLGQISCASCHIDGRTDRLSWDLGNPAGTMTAMTGIDADKTPATTVTAMQPPTKGPMLTQTLQDTMNSPSMHWSGDRADISSFASAFVTLQGADAPLSTAALGQLEDFLASIHVPPNPNRNLDNSYSTALAIPGPNNTILRTGNATAGAQEFEANCRSCHPGNSARGNLIRQGGGFGIGLNRRPPTWRNFQERDGLWFKSQTGSTSGFGFQQDGSFDSTHNQSRDDNMMAFMHSVNGGFPYTPAGLDQTNLSRDTHAAVGRQILISSATTTAQNADLTTLIQLAERGEIGLVARAQVNGVNRSYAYVGDGVFQSDRQAEWLATSDLRAISGALFTAVPAGSEIRIGIDRDEDGILDGDDSDPFNATPPVPSQTNIANHGTATQSSDYASNFGAAAAIDGSNNTFTATAATDTNSSWTLTLDNTYAIDRLVIVNRAGFESRLRDITIYFYDSTGAPIFRSHFLNRNNHLLSPSQLTVDLTQLNGAAVHAKSLRIVRTPDPFGRGQQIPTNTPDEANELTLAEVQVFGAISPSDTVPVGATPRPLPGGTFESIDTTLNANGYIYAPTGTPMRFDGQSGIAGNGSGMTNQNPVAPEGTQVAFLQNTGAFQESINLAAGWYRLSFQAAQRGAGNSTAQTVIVQVDNQELGRFSPPDKNYASFQSSALLLTAGTHTFRFVGLGQNANGTAATDSTVLLDNLRLANVSGSLGNPGFEAPVLSTYQYGVTGGSWTFTSQTGANGSGITANASTFTNANPNAPEGKQVAFLQSLSTISQTMTNLTPGQTYTVTFAAAQRGSQFQHGGQSWNVTLDGSVIASYNPGPSATAYTDYTASFVASAANQTLAFVGTDLVGGDNTVFLDNVRIASGPLTFAAYEQQYFTPAQRANPAISNPDADANGDGVSNLLAGALGLDPWTSALGSLPATGQSNGALTLTYPRRKGATAWSSVVEVSSDLVTWNSGPGYTTELPAISLSATTEQVTVQDNTPMAGQTARFMRLKVSQP